MRIVAHEQYDLVGMVGVPGIPKATQKPPLCSSNATTLGRAVVAVDVQRHQFLRLEGVLRAKSGGGGEGARRPVHLAAALGVPP